MFAAPSLPWGSFQPDPVPCGLSAWGSSSRGDASLPLSPASRDPLSLPAASPYSLPGLHDPPSPLWTPIFRHLVQRSPPGGLQVQPQLANGSRSHSSLLKCCRKTDERVSFPGRGSFADPLDGWHSVFYLRVVLTYSSNSVDLSDVEDLRNFVTYSGPPRSVLWHLPPAWSTKSHLVSALQPAGQGKGSSGPPFPLKEDLELLRPSDLAHGQEFPPSHLTSHLPPLHTGGGEGSLFWKTMCPAVIHCFLS